ncbi:DUF2798 domain-containing protein [Polymorphum gilvum]|uniref:Permease, major facilitator superfamily n=1 Tax=Polymorphum gilvum (strain LMG 25793 / CGMCC 1.9160 / SL003B-26A1) TaxID=991905 RepID=F2J4T9_POLGS|nr:DUF2798 domain-containing protein [Polymorphum gilvum]ADZ69031.1 Permease, major facilitator superfamily [Polymorphum gilvum SL003B-26A1]
MQSKELVVVAQIFISLLMALFMTGLFSLLESGPSTEWLRHWGLAFVTAWPIAFCASLVIGPIGFRIAVFVLSRRSDT